jgi:hypothetical protein
MTLDKVILARLVFIDELSESDPCALLEVDDSPLTAQGFCQKTLQLYSVLD